MPQQRKHADHAARQAAYHARCREARKQELTERGIPASPPVPTMPGTARWTAAIGKARSLLDIVQTEMQSYYDDRSQVWQEGERGEIFQERIASVESVLDALADLLT